VHNTSSSSSLTMTALLPTCTSFVRYLQDCDRWHQKGLVPSTTVPTTLHTVSEFPEGSDVGDDLAGPRHKRMAASGAHIGLLATAPCLTTSTFKQRDDLPGDQRVRPISAASRRPRRSKTYISTARLPQSARATISGGSSAHDSVSCLGPKHLYPLRVLVGALIHGFGMPRAGVNVLADPVSLPRRPQAAACESGPARLV